MGKRLNILMYSHDSFGLGHSSRTLAIASTIAAKIPQSRIIIATGLSIFGKFKLPDNVEYVRFPGIRKISNKKYVSEKLDLKFNQIKKIRSQILKAVARTFKPNLFIVDKTPLGIKGELNSTLKYFHKHHPRTRIILGVRDILDSPQTVKQEWEESGVFDYLRRYYHEIWIYGDPEIYNFVEEYHIPSDIREKMIFTGYLKKPVNFRRGMLSTSRKPAALNGSPMVLVTVGGGEDGYPVLDQYFKLLELSNGKYRHVIHYIYTGPFMPSHQKKDLKERARKLPNVHIRTFSRHFLRTINQADLVVSMGGYNTTAEILCYQKDAIIIPRVYPRQEQLIRAKIFEQKGIVKMLKLEEMSPEILDKHISEMLFGTNGKDPLRFARVATNGLETIIERVRALANL